MHTILFHCPCHIFCSGPLSICIRVSHVDAWGLVGSLLGWSQCIPSFSALSYQFLSILGAPCWKTSCLLGPGFCVCMWKLGGPHSKATLTTNMKFAKHYGVFDGLCCCLATCHCHINQQFFNFGQQHAPLLGA